MCISVHVQWPLVVSRFIETRIFSMVFRKNVQIADFMKIRPTRAELVYVEGQT